MKCNISNCPKKPINGFLLIAMPLVIGSAICTHLISNAIFAINTYGYGANMGSLLSSLVFPIVAVFVSVVINYMEQQNQIWALVVNSASLPGSFVALMYVFSVDGVVIP